MKSKITNDAFTRTRKTWLTLTGAGALWLGACVWAYYTFDFNAGARPTNGQQPALVAQEQIRLLQEELEAIPPLDSLTEITGSQAQTETAELAHVALEAEEQARFDAQGMAAERRQRSTDEVRATVLNAQAAEQQAQVHEASSVQKANLTAETGSSEKARLAEQAKAAAQARLAAEVEVAEQAVVSEKARSTAQASLAAEIKAAKQAILEEEAKAAEQTRLNTEVDVAERNRLSEEARAAAAEASRIASLARQQRGYNSGRARELAALEDLSARLQFASGSATVSRQTERVLDDIFNPLYLYSELPILVSVATNEYDGTTEDGLLSRDRGRAIASYLIDRGLEKDRFRIRIESGEVLSPGTYSVSVSAEEVRQ